MTSPLVLVTGANGFIGTHIVDDLLKDGYRVRGVARRFSDRLAKLFEQYGTRFEQVQVKDITQEGAFDEHLSGVDFVIHTASPMPDLSVTEYQTHFYDPAIKGVTVLLDGAYKHKSIKRIVTTGSIADVLPPTTEIYKGYQGYVFTEKDRMDAISQSTPVGDGFEAYNVSKILADRAIWEWQAAHPSASFTLATVYNSATFGRNLTQEKAEEISGTNAYLWTILTTGSPGFVNASVHVDDVSRAHIIALDEKRVPDGTKLIISEPYIQNWLGAIEIAKKNWPERNWSDVDTPTPLYRFDNTETNRLLGLQYKTLETQVKDVVQQMIELGA